MESGFFVRARGKSTDSFFAERLNIIGDFMRIKKTGETLVKEFDPRFKTYYGFGCVSKSIFSITVGYLQFTIRIAARIFSARGGSGVPKSPISWRGQGLRHMGSLWGLCPRSIAVPARLTSLFILTRRGGESSVT